MEDVGGLNYKITVKNLFSDALTRFNDQTKKATENWRNLKASFRGATVRADAGKNLEQLAEGLEILSLVNTRKIRAVGEAFAATRTNLKGGIGITRRGANTVRIAAGALNKLSEVNTRKLRNVANAVGAIKVALSPTGGTGPIVSRASVNSLAALGAALTSLSAASGGSKSLATTLNTITASLQAFTTAAVAARTVAVQLRRSLGPLANSARRASSATQRLSQTTASAGASASTASAPMSRLRRLIDSVDNSANRAAFTFRRLFGILAAFAAARLAIQGFFGLVRSIIDFNAKVEQAELGIASLLAQLTDVRDEAGNIQSVGQALESAFGVARDQVNLLRRDALTTAATFEELLFAFQTAIGPGVRAAFDVEQIRKFTLSISQAATAIGLEQNQLAEEIRSLLQGTISARTTRIATVLGISSEDVKQAREAGILFEFLETRLKAFNEAGNLAKRNFLPLLANLNGAFRLLLGTGGLEFFEDLKDSLEGLFGLITDQDAITGLITPDATAVKIIQTITDSFKEAARQVRIFIASFDATQADRLATAFASLIRTLTIGIGGAIQGVAEGFVDLQETFSAVRSVAVELNSILRTVLESLGFDVDADGFREYVRVLTRLATVLASVIAATSALKLVLIPLTATLALSISTGSKLAKGLFALGNAYAYLTTTTVAATFATSNFFIVLGVIASGVIALTGVLGGLALILTGVKNAFKEGGDDISYLQTARILAASLATSFKTVVNVLSSVIAGLELLVSFVRQKLTQAFIALITTALIPVIEQVLKLVNTLAPFNDTAKEVAAKLLDAKDALKAFQKENLDNSKKRNLQQLRAEFEQLGEATKAAQKDIDKAFEDSVAKIITGDVTDVTQAINSFSDSLLSIPATISNITQAFSETSDVVKSINDEIEKLDNAALNAGGGGQQNDSERSLQTLNKSIFESEDKIEGLQKTIKDLGQQQVTILAKQLRLKRDIADLDGGNERAAKELVAQSRDLVDQISRRKSLEAELATQVSKRDAFASAGDVQKASEFNDKITALTSRIEDAVSAEVALKNSVNETSKAFAGSEDGRKLLATVANLVKSENDLKSAKEQQLIVEEAVQEVREHALTLAGKQAEVIQRNIIASTELANIELRREKVALKRRIATADASELVKAETETALKLLEIDNRRADLRKEFAKAEIAQSEIIQQLSVGTDEKAFSAAIEALEGLRTKLKLELDKADLEAQLVLALAGAVDKAKGEKVAVDLFGLGSDNTLASLDNQLQQLKVSVDRQRISLLDEDAELQKLAKVRGELLILQEQLRQSALRQSIEQAKIGFEISAQETTEEQRVLLREKLLRLTVAQKLEEEALRQKIAETTDELNEQTSLVSNTYESFFKGIGRGIKESLQIDTLQQEGQKLALDIGNTFKSTISQGIIAAFNPDQNFDAVEAARAMFLRIADTALQVLANELILKPLQNSISGLVTDLTSKLKTAGIGDIFKDALSGLGGFLKTILSGAGGALSGILKGISSGVGGGIGSLFGFAQGGQITHAHAPGYATGGRISRRRKDPTDTVPIWAAPGEWVIKSSSVARYGHDVMNSINRGLVDPSALRSIVKAPNVSMPSAPAPGPGFASGGRIGSESGAPSQNATPSIALIAPSEQSMERMLKGGKQSFLDFIQQNQSVLKSILGN